MWKFDEIAGKLKPYSMRASWALVALLCAVYILRTNSMFLFQGGDNAYYVLLAKALAAGEGYRDTFRPDAPPHTQYPPMFPLMLAGIIVIHGVDIYLMKMIVSVSVAATLVLMFVLLRRQSFGWPLAAVVFMGCSIRIFKYSDDILSELVYIAFSLGALAALDKWIKADKWKYAAMAIIACWAAEMTRTAGMTLAAAIGVGVFFGKGKSKRAALWAVALTILCFIPLVAWSVRNRMVSDVATSYISQLLAVDPYDPTKGQIGPVEYATRFFINLRWHFLDTGGFIGAENLLQLKILDQIGNVFSWFYAFVVMTPLFALGFYRQIRRGISVMEAYTILFLLMTMSWPFAGYRYIMPIYPLIAAYVVNGAYYLHDVKITNNKKIRKGVFYIFIGLYFIIIAIDMMDVLNYRRNSIQQFDRMKVQVGDGIQAVAQTDVNFDHLLKVCRWLAKKGEPGVVMARKPTLVALAGGHTVTDIPMVVPSYPPNWLKEQGVRYIVVDEIYPQATKFMEAFTKGWTIPPGTDYTIPFRVENTVIVEITP